MRFAAAILLFFAFAGISLASANTILLNYGQNVIVNGTLIIAPSYPSSQTVNVIAGSGTQILNNVTIIAPPAPPPAPTHRTVNVIANGQVITLPQNNVTINSPLPPPHITYNAINDGNTITFTQNNVTVVDPASNSLKLNFTPSNVPQNGFIQLAPGINVSYLIANTIPEPVCPLLGSYTPNFNGSYSIVNSIFPCDLNYTINTLPSLNKTVNLSIGDSYLFHGLVINTPNKTQIERNQTYVALFDSYFNSNDSYYAIEPTTLEAASAVQDCRKQYLAYGLQFSSVQQDLYQCIIYLNMSEYTANQTSLAWHTTEIQAVGLTNALMYPLGFLVLACVFTYLFLSKKIHDFMNKPPAPLESKPEKEEGEMGDLA